MYVCVHAGWHQFELAVAQQRCVTHASTGSARDMLVAVVRQQRGCARCHIHHTRGVVRQVAASTLGRSEPGQNERVAADAFGCVPLAATRVPMAHTLAP
eukprot:COSAG01_NODE_5025_length_4539_cov_18.108559_5_plen_99_part_00